jgi:hypothetical protein
MLTDKLSHIWQVLIANPQTLQNPAMAKLFNKIIASAGLDPIDFGDLTKIPVVQETPVPVTPEA